LGMGTDPPTAAPRSDTLKGSCRFLILEHNREDTARPAKESNRNSTHRKKRAAERLSEPPHPATSAQAVHYFLPV
jgi:hypothetical protein